MINKVLSVPRLVCVYMYYRFQSCLCYFCNLFIFFRVCIYFYRCYYFFIFFSMCFQMWCNQMSNNQQCLKKSHLSFSVYTLLIALVRNSIVNLLHWYLKLFLFMSMVISFSFSYAHRNTNIHTLGLCVL